MAETEGTFLDQLKRLAATACATVSGAAAEVGAEAVVSIVISHPGTAEDAILVGLHEIDDLFAILARMQTGEVAYSLVSPDDAGPSTISVGGSVQ